jgi:hypothetical protein
VVGVVAGLELGKHEVDGGDGGDEEDDLDDGVVDRDEVGEQVEVAADKHQREQDLRPACNLIRVGHQRLRFSCLDLCTYGTWRRGKVVVASDFRKEDYGFEFCQAVRFYIYVLKRRLFSIPGQLTDTYVHAYLNYYNLWMPRIQTL